MATQMIHLSDLRGAEGAERTRFAVGGHWCELDMTGEEVDDLNSVLQPYLSSARKIGAASVPRTSTAPIMTPEQRDEIRDRAAQSTFDVAAYGRIPNKVLAAHRKAHEKSAA